MRPTKLGDGLIERSGLDPAVPNVRERVNTGAATPWVLLVFALAAGAFASYDFWGRAETARASAERATSELTLTRQRATEAEKKASESEGALAGLKAANQQLETDRAVLESEKNKADALAGELAKTFAREEGELTAASGKLTLDLLDKVLFRTAKAELTSAGRKVLRRVGAALNKYPDRSIWVIGHTDDVPVVGTEFASNWELSTARALSVVHFLIEDVSVDPRRLAAAGMGPYRPASKTDRSKNRRIELVLFPKDVALARP